MANKKRKTTKKPQSGKVNKNQGTDKFFTNEVKGICLIAVGLFIGLTFLFDTMGIVGEFIRSILSGFLGNGAPITALFIIWIGLNLFIDKREKTQSYKLWLFIALTLSTSLLCALIDNQTSVSSFNFSSLYSRGNAGVGGGILGGGISVLLCSLIGEIGLWIFSVAALLILFLILTGVSLGKLCRALGLKVSKKSKDLSKAAKEHREARKIEREKEIEKNDDDDNLVPLSPTLNISDDDLVRKNKNFSNEEQPIPENSTTFVLTEDEFPQLNDYPDEYADEIALRPDAPFHPKDISTGVLTAVKPIPSTHTSVSENDNLRGIHTPLPDNDGNFKEDNGDFEPPTLESMEEKLDSATQEAINRGVPLDRAVEAGQRIQKGEIVEATQQIDNLASKSIEETKIINYKMPPLSLLNRGPAKTQNKASVKNELEEKANRLLETLKSFHVEAKILNITQGPSVTRFELQPGLGVKVSKITNLANDIALSLAATGVRIEAPIPGKSAVGIEIPNENPAAVHIREVLDTDDFRNFKSKTAFALGKDISGSTVIADIAQFPHILIAGATGSGKSVCINSLITSILYKARPDEVKLIMVDPKMVELGVYNGIPHLLIPVVTNPKHAAGALNWAVVEMKRRYTELKNNKVRNIGGYNKLMEENGTPEMKMPEIVIIIDELADLMVAARSEVESSINSLAALARAAGMYLVIATQRPSVDVITGVIKANIPSRIAFAVSSQTDSRTIIDSAGADKLLGKGDMLYFPRGASKPTRIQGNFLSDGEIEQIIDFIKNQYEAEYDESIIEQIEREPDENSSVSDDMPISDERDDLFIKAVEMVIDSGQASVAMFQRKFKIGYQRAARLVDRMEELNIIGPYEGTKPRQVLMTRQEFNEMLMSDGE